ncbi:hypothetical protein [uncultured Lactobacillus sp.]|uniref:hypothetical protein n=1 Tax=uncultured Lactobacillus sp. TaxID=153152 RepID=UPI00260B5D23|nr:hypothetical protein [uncultured Lactobacillus sp.]
MAKYVYTVDEINISNVKECLPFTLNDYRSTVFEKLEDAKDYLVHLKNEWKHEYKLDEDDITDHHGCYIFINHSAIEARNCYLEAEINEKVMN